MDGTSGRRSSHRRRLRAALQRSQARAAEAERIAGVGRFDVDLRTGRQRGSAEMFRIFGLDPAGDVSVEVALSLLHADDAAAAAAVVERVRRDPAPYEIEFRVLRPDGRVRWVLARGEGVVDGGGRVVRIVGTNQDITERKLLEEQLTRQALHDPLTGLANRTLLRDRVMHALGRAARSGEAVALLVIDLDDFKTVNDTRGHEAGDELLVTVAHRLRELVRSSDTVARLGGDEFAILLEGVGDRDASHTAARVVEALHIPVDGSNMPLLVRASVGVAGGHRDPDDAEGLLRDADLAMYAAKRSGKSRYRLFTDDMRSTVDKRVRLEAELRRAVSTHEFRLQYQPVVDLVTGEVTGFEALLRWPRAKGRVVGPDTFVPVLERSGLIGAVGRWVLHEACSQAAAWQQRFGRPFSMSVNVSPNQLRTSELVDDVDEALESAGLPPSSLVIEITENVLVADVEQTVDTLRTLERHSVRTAVDDFGTGYSSLRYLQRLPVDAIKIDRSFVATMQEGNEHAALVQAIVHIGNAFHLGVVAEGVETREQRDLLLALGCGGGQGFLFSAPRDAADIDTLLAAR